MNSPDPKHLHELWQQRVDGAKLRLDFARNYMVEVRRDYPAGDIPEPDHQFALREALRSENFALAQYNKVLYSDLTVKGIIPDESAWLRAQGASGSGSGAEL
jgi:hypothetical protein